ncbi:MAG: serine--tRNA ligase, partial [Opitutaceae bacterium]|nr:serine--tRNA ligase [Opitutaceae bacterium]
MLDPKLLRDAPDSIRAAIAKKHMDVNLDAVIALDARWRAAVRETEALRADQKAASAEMARLPKGSPEFAAKISALNNLSAQVKERDAALK